MSKLDAVLNLISMLIAAVCFIVWLVALFFWDGDCHCERENCAACPFPCERRENDGLP